MLTSLLLALLAADGSSQTLTAPEQLLSQQSLRDLQEASQKYNVPSALLLGIVYVNQRATEYKKSGSGVMRITDEVCRQMYCNNPNDPRQNIYVGARYLRVLANQYGGEMEKMIAGYYEGRAPSRAGDERVPASGPKQRYVEAVIAAYYQYKAGGQAPRDAQALRSPVTSASPARLQATRPTHMPATRFPVGTRRSACESGHWIESVSSEGDIIKLEDGSIWEVGGVDTVTSMLWLPVTDVIVCDGKMINEDDNESIEVSRLR
jgi:hypothetical protein